MNPSMLSNPGKFVDSAEQQKYEQFFIIGASTGWCYMKAYSDASSPLEFLESELDLCHMFLDIAGPKPTASILAKVRQGYDTVCDCLGTVRDAAALARMNAKLSRLRERLLPFSTPGSPMIPAKEQVA
jgi:hypothetical protein